MIRHVGSLICLCLPLLLGAALPAQEAEFELSIPTASTVTLSTGSPSVTAPFARLAYLLAIDHLNEDREDYDQNYSRNAESPESPGSPYPNPYPYRFKAHPTCDTAQTILRAHDCAREMQGFSPVGMLGGSNSAVTLHMAVFATEWRLLQCSPLSTSPDLSAQDKYPYFFRVVPSDTAKAETTIALLIQFQWWYAAVIHTTDRYGAGLAEKLGLAAQSVKGGTMRLSYYTLEPNFHVTLPPAVLAKLQRDITFGIRTSQVKILISALGDGDSNVFLLWAWASGFVRPDYAWIGYGTFQGLATPEMLQLMDAGLVPSRDQFSNFFSIFQPMRSTQRQARLLASAAERFNFTTNTIHSTYGYLTYDCALAIGTAVKTLLQQNRSLSPSDLVGSGRSAEVAEQLRNTAFNLEFEGATGWVRFAKPNTPNAGDREPVFSISRWSPEGFFLEVGVHNTTRNSSIVFTQRMNFSELPDASPSCEAGTEFNATLSFAARRDVCQPCPVGKYKRHEDGAACLTCPPGFRCSDGINGTREPRSCEPGQYSGEGAQECSACDRGSYSSTPAASQCSRCPEGLYQDSPGATLCDVCSVGFYQSQPGSTHCQACPATQSTKTAASASRGSCGCPVNFRWAVDLNKCIQCQQGLLDCQRFNATPQVMLGYYLEEGAARDLEAIDLFRCSVAEWCPGEQKPGDPMCGETRAGLNCGHCADGFFKIGQTCRPCAGHHGSLYVLGILASFLASGVALRVGVRRKNHRGLAGASEGRLFLSITAGTTLAVVQRLGMIGRIGVHWPHSVSGVLSLSTGVFFSGVLVLTPPCIVPSSLFSMYLARLCTPLLFVLSCLFWWAVSRALLRSGLRWLPPISVFHVVNTTGLFVSALYIYTVMGALSLVDCYESPNGRRTIREFSFALCSGPDFNSALPLFALGMLIYGAGMMGMTLYALWIAPAKYGQSSGFRVMIHFLVSKFRPEKYWYSLVTILSSFLMALTTVIFPDSKFNQLVCMQILASAQFSAHCLHMPYPRHSANLMVNSEYFGLTVLLILGSYFYQEPLQSSAIANLTHTLLALLGLMGGLALCGVGWGVHLACALSPQSAGLMQQGETDMDVQFRRILCGCEKILGNAQEFRQLLGESSYVERARAVGLMYFLFDALDPEATHRGRLFSGPPSCSERECDSSGPGHRRGLAASSLVQDADADGRRLFSL